MGVPGRIGDIQPFAELARGGATVVYKARQESLDRTVLLKVLRSEFVRDEEMADRFEEEARLIARIQHPNVVTIHEFGRSEEGPYFVTEFVEGVDLEQLLEREEPLPLDVAVGLVVQAARGLGAAHRREILHRDVKPANLLLSTEGRVKLTDFGLAASIVQQAGSSSVSGTPGYIAPELIRGESPSPASDLFGLGAVLYEAVTGRPAFPGSSTSEHLDAALNRDPLARVEMSRRLPSPLRSILGELLEKDPERRIANASKAERRLSEVGVAVGLAGPEDLAAYLADPQRYEPVSVSPPERDDSEEEEPEENVAPTGASEWTGERSFRAMIDRRLRWLRQGDVRELRADPLVLAAAVLVLVLMGGVVWLAQPGIDRPAGVGSEQEPRDSVPPVSWLERPTLLIRSEPLALVDTGWVGEVAAAHEGAIEPGGAREEREARSGDRRSARRPSASATLRIRARPAADSLQVDGRTVGGTEGPITLEAGVHEIRVFRAPYPPVVDTLRLRSGSEEVLNVDFRRQVGWLVVEVNPWGVIFVDGTRRDTVPAPNTPNPITYMLSPGDHDLLVRNPESGRSDSVSVVLAPGDSVRRTFDLRPLP